MKNHDIQTQLLIDRTLRRKITGQSHLWFFSTYFPHYITHKTAEFHKELFRVTEDTSTLSVICAFRGSAKSTIATMSYPLWAIMGAQQKKFVVVASQTIPQAKIHLRNIKRELESNELLINDMGPFIEQTEEWGATSLYIPKYNARIMVVSTEQSVRGIRHGAHRPDLIIADDVEDMSSVKTREGRNKTFDWYTSEIIPAGDTYTKRIVVGNLLHEDSLLMRLKERIESNEIDGSYYAWPIMRDGKSLWPGKYPNSSSLELLRRSVASRVAWEREYMLHIIPDEDQIIDPKWIKFYDELPPMNAVNDYLCSYVSVDLAISLRTTADCTAIVIIHAYGSDPESRRYYIDRHFINGRISHLATLEAIKSVHDSLPVTGNGHRLVLVEQVQYQAAVVEQLTNMDIETVGIKIFNDKRARLSLASSLFEQGKVVFPRDKVIEPIIQQLVGFGVEKHDDLADAMSMGLNYIQTLPRPRQYRVRSL